MLQWKVEVTAHLARAHMLTCGTIAKHGHVGIYRTKALSLLEVVSNTLHLLKYCTLTISTFIILVETFLLLLQYIFNANIVLCTPLLKRGQSKK